jgi:hypothetical protein
MRKILTILIILILILISLNHSNRPNNLNDHLENQEPQEIKKYDTNDILINNSRALGRSRQINNNCGYWLDTFNDDSNIDLSMCDHLKITDGDAAINSTNLIDQDTVAYWDFDEGSGQYVNDNSNFKNNGTRGGSTSAQSDDPTWVVGKFGNALHFDGTNDYARVPHSNILAVTGHLTIDAWVKARGSATYLAIADKYHTISGTAYGYTFYLHHGTATLCIYSGSNGFIDSVYTTSDLRDDTWHHVAGVYNGTNVSVYIDGKVERSKPWSYGPAFSTDHLGIGTRFSGLPMYFDGRIDELRIQKRAYSATEIKNIYENGTWSKFSKANLTSKPINIPPNMHWDTLIINKTQPANAFLNISIFDASNNNKISGSPIYTNEGEFDISYIDPISYPKIKLNATLKSDGRFTPILHYYGVTWNSSKTWQDTSFVGLKVDSKDKVSILDGDSLFQNSGSLTSISINIPDKCYYNTLVVNKTEPTGGTLKVSILDEQSSSVISGFNELTNNQIDISGIDPKSHPAIKLKAIYTSSGEIGKLHDWSINWTENTEPHIVDFDIISTINRTYSAKIEINLSDLEQQESALELMIEYKSPNDSSWETNYLNAPTYTNGHWESIFTPTADADLGLYTFRVTCNDQFQAQDTIIETNFIEVLNNPPLILDVTSIKTTAKRTETITITVNASDIEIAENNLNFMINHKHSQSSNWESDYISNLKYSNNQWQFTFTASKTAKLGTHILKIICNDTITEVIEQIELEILNNKPTQPDVIILPFKPKTNDDLTVMVVNITDIETSLTNMEYWYKWYKNDYFIPEFENVTTIPKIATSKGEIWRCEVRPFDGDEPGLFGETEVIILNSPPIITKLVDNIIFFEDSQIILEKILMNTFEDFDNDILTFSSSGQENIYVEIIQENGTTKLIPDENWFGTEYITFLAHDSLAFTEITVTVEVKPLNDIPKIIQIGNKKLPEKVHELEYIVYEKSWLNLTIQVEDIDGDVDRNMINYIFNITERSNLYFDINKKQLCFIPENDDVGLHYINLKVTDNNETPIIYISQNIKIIVFNINNPPTVKITLPINASTFNERDKINFKCIGEDIDIFIQNSVQMFLDTVIWVILKI